jgi:hypothetical protein
MKGRLRVAVASLTLTACVAVVCFRPSSCINADSCRKIEVGMTHQQVRDVLGGPPRNESACPFETLQFSTGLHLEEWWGRDIAVSVWFDANGIVCDRSFKTHEYGSAMKPSIWEVACSWLPW